jgi:O-antigen/teichoic acid export membrane protein
VRKYYSKAKTLAFSSTARDTYILFIGNVISAFLGFLFTLLVARALSVSDFGIFSAANNLVLIMVSVTDLGVTSGIVNFVAKMRNDGKERKEMEFIKAGFLTRILSISVIALLMILFAPFISTKLLATPDPSVAVWTAIIALGFFAWGFFPFVLQARKKFLQSAMVDISLGSSRVIFTFLLFIFGLLTVNLSLAVFAASAVVGGFTGMIIVGFKFWKSKPKISIYKRLLRFSGWLGVNKIVSAISGRLDVAMLAAMVGATATGFYSIPSRLATFVVVLASSFTSVLSPRFAAFKDDEKAKHYLKKATLALVPIIAGIILWIIIAKPFIVLLFGEKYLPAVPVFQALTASMIPFLMTVPSVSAIIYAMEKPVYIGSYSFVHLALTFVLNLIFIPRFDALGPTITFGIVHIILAIYTWTIVIRHYWFRKLVKSEG